MSAAVSALEEKAVEKLGGSRILFQVDAGALREAMLTELRDDVYRIVREERIPFAGLSVRGGGVELKIAEDRDRQRLVSKLASSVAAAPARRPPGVTDSGDGLIRFAPTETEFAERVHRLAKDSAEMIEQRLRNAGIRLAIVEPDGADRVRLLLPGVLDPERLSAMLAKQARVSFRLVDVSTSAERALQAGSPPNSEVVYHFKTRQPYLLFKEVAVEGDDIIEADPGIDPVIKQPIATFRFNGRGSRRFAHVTADNVGKMFAVVVDDVVVSASVIREPILGGSGAISGNLTIEEANTIAMLLRSGTLPGRLSVVEQQVLQPAGAAAKP